MIKKNKEVDYLVEPHRNGNFKNEKVHEELHKKIVKYLALVSEATPSSRLLLQSLPVKQEFDLQDLKNEANNINETKFLLGVDRHIVKWRKKLPIGTLGAAGIDKGKRGGQKRGPICVDCMKKCTEENKENKENKKNKENEYNEESKENEENKENKKNEENE